MVVEISNTTLTRLVNYEAVTRQKYQEANKRQWRIMTLEVMQECEKLKEEMGRIGQIAAYSLYLYKVQNGLSPRRYIYAEPAINQGLIDLLKELDVPINMIPDRVSADT